ncbi:hypothetical protein EO95_12610 [Methanosarcina sp. 1.H.T.1A.1]|uniref:hypothetical protein n=2 Tax=unclassified Methanosarcina TaxID=2644672 RepID=UPI000622B2C2|nr:hypothetical protein [Methanosarcina sp. 1.H.T.1A.1]KKH94832.1 hypothetical protein EO95_12610 [Methanosarcina sp. 1.H.T.1A.1]
MHLLDIKVFGKRDEMSENTGLPLDESEYLFLKLEGAMTRFKELAELIEEVEKLTSYKKIIRGLLSFLGTQRGRDEG